MSILPPRMPAAPRVSRRRFVQGLAAAGVLAGVGQAARAGVDAHPATRTGTPSI